MSVVGIPFFSAAISTSTLLPASVSLFARAAAALACLPSVIFFVMLCGGLWWWDWWWGGSWEPMMLHSSPLQFKILKMHREIHSNVIPLASASLPLTSITFFLFFEVGVVT